MSTIRVPTAFHIDLEFEAASPTSRILAYAVDISLLSLYLIVVRQLLYAVLNLSRGFYLGMDILVISLPMLLYPLLMEVLNQGQTVGKKLMGIRVISLDGGDASLNQFLIRWATRFFEWPFLFGYIVTDELMLPVYLIITGILGLGAYVPILVSAKSQRLGDLAAGTIVVKTGTDLNIADTLFRHVSQPEYQPMFPEVMKLSDGDLNTITSVLSQNKRYTYESLCERVAQKVKEVLSIQTDMPAIAFLERLLEDYNYLATRENTGMKG